MPEPIFLLLLMVVTGLGVWTFLGQLNSGRLSLPRPRLRLPKPGQKRRKKSRRARASREDQAFEAYGGGSFDAAYSVAGPFAASLYTQAADEEQALDDDYAEDLPSSQVDFFADDSPDERPAGLRSVSLAPESTLEPGPPPVSAAPAAPGVDGEPSAETPSSEPSPVYTVEATEPDPDDIMSFFEKPTATSQMPETLRESLETVAAADLLAEARELRSLLQRRRDAA